MTNPFKIFIAYSRADETLLNELRLHFSPLEKSKKVKIWYDGLIDVGDEWEESIKYNLYQSDIILLLVSAASLASDYFYDVELKKAMDRHEKGEAKVIPLILKPCKWDATVLSKLQAIPKDGQPVTTWDNHDLALHDCVDQVWTMLQKLAQERQDRIAMQKKLERQKIQQEERQRKAEEKLRKQEESKRKAEQDAIIKENSDWNYALSKQTISAYNKYIKHHPTGKHVHEAKSSIEKIRKKRQIKKEEKLLKEKSKLERTSDTPKYQKSVEPFHQTESKWESNVTEEYDVKIPAIITGPYCIFILCAIITNWVAQTNDPEWLELWSSINEYEHLTFWVFFIMGILALIIGLGIPRLLTFGISTIILGSLVFFGGHLGYINTESNFYNISFTILAMVSGGSLIELEE